MEFRLARDEHELAQAHALRERVFRREQGVVLACDHPDGLGDALQVVAVEDDVVVGTCRVLILEDTPWLGRLVVEPALRRRGIAQGVLAAAEDAARDAGFGAMMLHSQGYIEKLYSRAGYRRCAEPFVEHGIPHVTMEKPLA